MSSGRYPGPSHRDGSLFPVLAVERACTVRDGRDGRYGRVERDRECRLQGADGNHDGSLRRNGPGKASKFEDRHKVPCVKGSMRPGRVST